MIHTAGGGNPLAAKAKEESSMVRINGTACDAIGQTVMQYLQSAGYDPKRVAVELNGDIVPKSQYESVRFADGDSAEVVSFVGGG